MSQVRTLPVPPEASALARLDRVDYQDAFAVPVDGQLTATRWLVTALDAAAPPVLRLVHRIQRSVLGLRVGPPGQLLGWDIREERPDVLVLGVEGGLLTPRLVLRAGAGEVVVSTLIRYDRPVPARLVWTVIAPLHRAVARYLLRAAAGRAVPVPVG